MPANQSQGNGREGTIVLADDEPAVLDTLRRFLDHDKYISSRFDLFTASTSRDAIDRIKEGGVVALVTDGSMDGQHIDGELANGLYIARVALSHNIPPERVILMSGQISPYQEEAEMMHITFFQKPYNQGVICGYLRACLPEPQPQHPNH